MEQNLDRTFGFLLTDIARLLRQDFEKRMRESGTGATRSQWRVMAHLLRTEGINQTQLAERMEVAPITLARLIDKLEARGYVERRPDPSDRRAYHLYLTEAAHPYIEVFGEVSAALRERVLAGLTATERQVLIGLLMRMKGNLTNKSPERLLEAVVHE